MVGLEHLTQELTERWLIHLRVWWRSPPDGIGTPPHVLHIAEDGSQAALCLRKSDLLTVIHLPSLATRREDIVYLIHAEASGRDGGLADFESGAIDFLVRHEWPADWCEVRALVNHLYDNSKRDVPFTFDEEQVRRSVGIVAGSLARMPPAEPQTIWRNLRSLGDQCNTLSASMLGKPFFPDKTFDDGPLNCPNPQLRLSRLVSWSYKTFLDRDGAADTLDALLKLPLGNQGSPKDIKNIRDLFQNWRTLEQHPSERSDRGEKMRRRVAEWSEKACGAATPGDPHWERCVACLLLELQQLLSLLLERLQGLCAAAEQETLVAQWRDFLEMSWPKHKHDQLLNQVLVDLGRTELLAAAVGNDLLKHMQTQLTFYSPSSNRELHMRSWLEEEILRRFPRPPVTGADLVSLGVPPAQMEYWLRRCNRLHREQGKDRDELLGLVASELQSSSRPENLQFVSP